MPIFKPHINCKINICRIRVWYEKESNFPLMVWIWIRNPKGGDNLESPKLNLVTKPISHFQLYLQQEIECIILILLDIHFLLFVFHDNLQYFVVDLLSIVLPFNRKQNWGFLLIGVGIITMNLISSQALILLSIFLILKS